MSNEIKIQVCDVEVTVKSVSGKFAMICTTISFAKGGQVVKEIDPRDIKRFVRPENRATILDAVKATEAAVAASDEHKANMERQADLDKIDDHQERMARVMAVQG